MTRIIVKVMVIGLILGSLSLGYSSSDAEGLVENSTSYSFIIDWNQRYGGANDEWLFSAIQTTDGGFVFAGWTNSYGSGNLDMWLVKTDSAGQMEWNQTYGGSLTDGANAVIQTADGGYMLGGWTELYGAGSFDIWIVKTDMHGESEWNQTFGGVNDEFLGQASLISTVDGGYAFVGVTQSYGAGLNDFWLIKLNHTGVAAWNQTYGGSSDDIGESIVQTTDGGYLLGGWTGDDEDGDIWLIKTYVNGSEKWNQTYDGAETQKGASIIQTMDDGY
ncbi:MAG: hypothetical protein ACW99Q_25960, partial [Candidatus Kariarchaeaceae archaeon]